MNIQYRETDVPFGTAANDPDVPRIRRDDAEEFTAKRLECSTNKQDCPYSVITISYLNRKKANVKRTILALDVVLELGGDLLGGRILSPD